MIKSLEKQKGEQYKQLKHPDTKFSKNDMTHIDFCDDITVITVRHLSVEMCHLDW